MMAPATAKNGPGEGEAMNEAGRVAGCEALPVG